MLARSKSAHTGGASVRSNFAELAAVYSPRKRLGFALGIVVAGAFEMTDDRLYSNKEIRKLLPAEVIGEIPAIVSSADAEIARRKLWQGWTTAGVVLVIILAGSAFSYLRG